MKKVSIKYNPYKPTTEVNTEITVDGKAPKSNSALNVTKGFRLQEWIEKLPQILIDEYRDRNFDIVFTGTETDYSDLVASVNSCGDSINAKCTLYATPNIEEVEKTIDEIFEEIKGNEEVPELRTPEIISAFEKAKSSCFEVNVVATMSSGKSTLINALLGQHLMPAANEATTATIVKIIDTDSECFSAVAYDKSCNKVEEVGCVDLEKMKSLNSNPRVSTIEIRGKIPFVKTVGMRLVLVDTPGPNNSRDSRHADITNAMISNSDKSLVLFVMNGHQLGVNDEKVFLEYIYEQMAKGGKKSRDRFIFAVNKMDAYKPWAKEDGVGCIRRVLDDAKSGLEKQGIINPNLFPVASLPALQLRELLNGVEDEEDEDDKEISKFAKRCRKYDEMQFESYHEFSHLPLVSRRIIDDILQTSKSIIETHEYDDLKPSKIAAQTEMANLCITEIHTGIVSIEQAISMYVNKYARTQKVWDLVQSFNGKLEEMQLESSIKKQIKEDKKKADELQVLISEIRNNINSAREAKSLSKEIDKIDLTPDVKTEVDRYLDRVKDRINGMMSGDTQVKKSEAMAMCADLEKQCKAIHSQIRTEIQKILEKAYRMTLTKIVDEYKKHLATLNMGPSTNALAFNPVNLVSASLTNLNQIIDENTESVDEGRYEKQRKEGGFLRKAASFLTFGLVDDYTWVPVWQPVYVDYVDMSEVTADYLEPFQRNLKDVRRSAIEHVSQETRRLKEHLKIELIKIDKKLDEKLERLSQTEADSKATAEDIAGNEAKLKWLTDIKQRVKNIIEF